MTATQGDPRMAEAPVQPTEPQQRIVSLPAEDMRPEWLATLDRIPGAGLKGDGFPRNVLGVLMHNPDTFGPFLEYWVTCKEKMSLTVREQELVILRMACLFRSDYVWKHHVPVATEFGVDADELRAVRDADLGAFGPREAALLVLTDEMVEDRMVSTASWRDSTAVLSDTDVVDLIGLVSQYVLFALANNVAQVRVEAALDDVAGLGDA
jgi:4-carboxymuconolactone decarboxylase